MELNIFDKIQAKLTPEKYFLKTHEQTPDFRSSYLFSFDVDDSTDVKLLPSMVEKLTKYKQKACFALIGQYVEKFPKEHFAFKGSNNELVNHSFSHPFHHELNPKKVTELSDEELVEEIRKTDKIIKEITGVKVSGWRTPHFGFQAFDKIYPILEKEGYRYSSSVSDFAVKKNLPFKIAGVYEIPISSSSTHPLCVFDTWSYLACPTPLLTDPEKFFELWKHELIFAREHNILLNHYFDPSHLEKYGLFERMLKFLSDQQFSTRTYSEYLDELQ